VQLKDDALIVATVKGQWQTSGITCASRLSQWTNQAPLIIKAVELPVFTEPVGKFLRKLRISFNDSSPLDERPPGLEYYYFAHKKVDENTVKTEIQSLRYNVCRAF
jgi:hypothetical protein